MADRVAPVAESERIASVDVLRGVAVLGIFAMNIVAFAQPFIAYMNPGHAAIEPHMGPFRGLNAAAWWFAYVLFDQKMMSIFSMLFGAGLVFMDQRREARAGRGLLGVYYRRLLWLFLIGLAHAYLLWYGDILVLYAICGLLLYPLRRLRPRTLAILGAALVFVVVPISAGLGLVMSGMRAEAAEAERLIAQGRQPSAQQREMLKAWNETREGLDPTPEQVEAQIDKFRGPYPVIFRANAKEAFAFQTLYTMIWGLWRATGMMLIGMALAKSGVFSATRSPAFYRRMLLLGYGIGLPAVITGAVLMARRGFDPIWAFAVDGQFNYLGSIPVALGHVALVMLFCQAAPRFGPLARGMIHRLGAAGRMALTNYLAQSLIGAGVFFGWGLGYYATLTRWQLWLVALGVWAVQLLWSPWWLARFRFGPAEWLWRTLTYARPQPMRKAAAPALPAPPL